MRLAELRASWHQDKPHAILAAIVVVGALAYAAVAQAQDGLLPPDLVDGSPPWLVAAVSIGYAVSSFFFSVRGGRKEREKEMERLREENARLKKELAAAEEREKAGTLKAEILEAVGARVRAELEVVKSGEWPGTGT